MIFKIFDKKGEKMFSFIWLVYIILVCGIVAIGVGMIYSADINIKNEEAKFLYYRIYDCIIEDGQISEKFLVENFDIFSECDLNERVFSEEIFAFRVRLYDEKKESLVKEIKGGFPDIDEKCVNANIFEANANCVKNEKIEFYVENKNLKKGYLEVFTASINENE
jgi:hypothetical protein